MCPPDRPDDPDGSPFDQLLADYMVRMDRGEQVDREAFIRAHAEFADQLRAHFEDSEAIGRVLEGAQPPSEASPSPRTHSVRDASPDTATSPAFRTSTPMGPPSPNSPTLPADLEQVMRYLTDCGQVSRKDLQETLGRLSPEGHPVHSTQLAEALHREGKLSALQRDAIRDGKTEDLVLGNYVLLDRLGRGGMGQVYKTWHRRMGRVVALKTLLPDATKSEEAMRRFRREVKAAARLIHPNIVTAYDADECRGTYFLVMEYVVGTNLADWVKEHGPAPLNEAVNWLLQAAQALDYAHHHGVVHRDVKPGNLLLSEEGAVKVLDMGLARIGDRLAATEAEDRLTRTGDVLGTVDYMAPEQALDTRRADHRADVYSLGCTLHYLLLARPPYGGQTLGEKLLGHRNHAIPSLHAARADVPEWLDTLFQRMLAEQAGDRPESMAQVIAELEQHREPSDSSPGSDPASREGVAPAGRRARWSAAMVVGVVILGLILAAVYALRTSEGTLTVEVNEPGAKVEVLDAKGTVTVRGVTGADPLVFSVAPGKHSVKVQRAGFEFFSQEFVMEVRGKQTVRATLEQSKSEQAACVASKHLIESTRELDEALKAVNENLAAGKWTPVTSSSIAEWSFQERKTFTRVPEKPALTDGRILLREMWLVSPFRLRDGALRAKVRLIEGSQFGLAFRSGEHYLLNAVYNDGLWAIGRLQAIAPRWVSLDSRRQDRKYEGEHEITIAAVGEIVAFYLDGQPTLAGRDATPMRGWFNLGTDNGSAAEFRDVSFLVL